MKHFYILNCNFDFLSLIFNMGFPLSLDGREVG
jgi:hypothetical protein